MEEVEGMMEGGNQRWRS